MDILRSIREMTSGWWASGIRCQASGLCFEAFHAGSGTPEAPELLVGIPTIVADFSTGLGRFLSASVGLLTRGGFFCNMDGIPKPVEKSATMLCGSPFSRRVNGRAFGKFKLVGV